MDDNAQRDVLMKQIIGAGQKSYSSAECIISFMGTLQCIIALLPKPLAKGKKGEMWLNLHPLFFQSLLVVSLTYDSVSFTS